VELLKVTLAFWKWRGSFAPILLCITRFLSNYMTAVSPTLPSSVATSPHQSATVNNVFNGNGLLFHMTQPTSSTIKAIACSKPTINENQSKWKHNGTIADQCKQRRAPCHTGLAKGRGGHLVNQPKVFKKVYEKSFRKCMRAYIWSNNNSVVNES